MHEKDNPQQDALANKGTNPSKTQGNDHFFQKKTDHEENTIQDVQTAHNQTHTGRPDTYENYEEGLRANSLDKNSSTTVYKSLQSAKYKPLEDNQTYDLSSLGSPILEQKKNMTQKNKEASRAQNTQKPLMPPPDFLPPPSQSGVRRVNDRPLYILLGIGGAFLLMMIIVASHRSQKEKEELSDDEISTLKNPRASENIAQSITRGWESGIIPPEEKKSAGNLSSGMPRIQDYSASSSRGTLGGHNQSAVSSDKELLASSPKALPNASHEKAPSPSFLTQTSEFFQPSSREKSDQKFEDMRIEKFKEAVKSSTKASFEVFESSSSAHSSSYQERENFDPAEIYAKSLKGIQSFLKPSNQDETATADGNKKGSKEYSQFEQTKEEERWNSKATVQNPRGRCFLRTGSIIPALLISGINSDLPGMILGQVSHNVFDTASGSCLLIPQGSKLIGSYSSSVNYGQSRVLVAWQRVIFPDGRALDLGAMPGSDSSGQAGFYDQVDNHYFRIFGSAFLMSAITAGFNYGKEYLAPEEKNEDTKTSLKKAFAEASGQQMTQVTAGMLSKNLSISPTLEIRPGYRLSIVVTKDLLFPDPPKVLKKRAS